MLVTLVEACSSTVTKKLQDAIAMPYTKIACKQYSALYKKWTIFLFMRVINS